MDEVSIIRSLLLSKFDSTWRGPCDKVDSVKGLVDWLFGYPIHPTKLSPLQHEVEFVDSAQSMLNNKVLLQYPDSFRIMFLESVIKFLRQGSYTIVRFRCLAEKRYNKLTSLSSSVEAGADKEPSLIVSLLGLLNELIQEGRKEPKVYEALLELIGMLGVGGVSVRELKALFRLVADGPHWQRLLKGETTEERADTEPSLSDAQGLARKAILGNLRQPILKAIVAMTSFDDGQHKARPSSLWSLSGKGSGLLLDTCVWPFGNEYAFSAWIRIHTVPKIGEKAFLWDFTTPSGAGVSVYLKGCPSGHRSAQIYIHCCDISDANATINTETVIPNTELRTEIWYHVSVRHGAKGSSSGSSRSSALGWLSVNKLFNKEEFSVLIDGEVVYEEELSVPRTIKSKASLLQPTIGKDFNGQMGDVYLFREAVSSVVLNKLMEASSGFAGTSATSLHKPSLPPDMDPAFDPGRRVLSERLLAVYSPTRTSYIHRSSEKEKCMALEVHSSLHAHLVGNTHAWNFTGTDPKDVIGSLGGLRCLFPLLAPLINTPSTQGSSTQVGEITKTNSLSDEEPKSPTLADDEEDEEDYSDDEDDEDEVVRVVSNATEVLMTCEFGESDLRGSASSVDAGKQSKPGHKKKHKRKKKSRDEADLFDDSEPNSGASESVAVLLRIFARFLKDHEANQREMLRIGGVNLLSWTLIRAADKGYLRRCQDKEVGRSLLELSSACREHPQLGRQIDTHVLFDLRIWSKGSLMMQLSVLPVMVSVLRSDPSLFVPRVMVAPLLESLRLAYCRGGVTNPSTSKQGPPIKDFMEIFSGKSVVNDENTEGLRRRTSFFYRQNSSSASYDPVVTEWHLRSIVLTILRIVLETLTKAEITSAYQESPKTSEDVQTEVDRTYNLIGAGWSTVSAAIYVSSLDPSDSDNFTRFMMGTQQMDTAGRVGGRMSATTSPADLSFSSSQTGAEQSRGSVIMKKQKEGSRLSSDMGLILQVLAECQNRTCVHAIGTVLLDLLRDSKLPSRFLESIAIHFDNSWEVASTFMLTAVANHASGSEELCCLGIRLLGALLKRTYLDESGKVKKSFMGSLVGFQRKATASDAGRSSMPSHRQSGPVIGKEAGGRPGLAKQSSLSDFRDTAGTGGVRVTSIDKQSILDIDSELSTSMALSPDYLGRTMEEDKNNENYVAVQLWNQQGGGRILYRLLKQRLEEKGSLGEEVYGAVLELIHLSDLLAANMTTVYATKVKNALNDRIRATNSQEDPFLLSDYPQIESALFIPPPSSQLAEQITSLFQLPRVRNVSGVKALLMILPKLPQAQQDKIWKDLSILIGKSSNLKVLLYPENELLSQQWTTRLYEMLKRSIKKKNSLREEDSDDVLDSQELEKEVKVKFAAVSVSDEIPQTPVAEEEVQARRLEWFNLSGGLLAELVAWSVWVGVRTQRSSLRTLLALSQKPSRDESTPAAALRTVLSRAITSIKEKAYVASRANAAYIVDYIEEKSPKWEMMLDLLFVTAAACVQQTYVSVLGSRSVREATSDWVRPSAMRSHNLDMAAAALEADPEAASRIRESVYAGGGLLGESYLSADGVFASLPPLIALDEDQQAADALLALQILELFDMLLWPSSVQGHKSLDLLTENNKRPAGPVGRFNHQPPMLMTMTQLSLICLAGTHPADPVAFENALRIRRLVQWLIQQPAGKLKTKASTEKMSSNTSSSSAASQTGRWDGTATDWLILTVVHIHFALRQIQYIIFTPAALEESSRGGSRDILLDLKQAACTAEQLMKILSLIASANDSEIKSTFSTKNGEKGFSEVLMSSHADSGRLAAAAINPEGVMKAMSWLRDSTWLTSPVASLPNVHAVVKRVGNEETAFDEGLADSLDTLPVIEGIWDKPSESELDLFKRAEVGKKKLAKGVARNKKMWKRQRAAVHRAQASSWARTLTMNRRAAWSPWMEALLQENRSSPSEVGVMPAATWKLGNHRDAFGRRMLLQRNFTYGHHDDSSYNSHRQTKQNVDVDTIKLATEASSLLRKVGRPTMGPQDGDALRRRIDEDEDTDEENEEEEFGSDDELGMGGLSPNSRKNSKSPLRSTAPRAMVKDVKFDVQLLVLGVTVPGTLVLTEYHAVFAHNPVALAEMTNKRSQGKIPPYLIQAPLTWRLDKLVEVHNRRFNLEPCAVELYFADGQDIFIAFDGKIDARRKFWKGIQHRAVSGAVALLRHVPKSRKPHKVLMEAKLTDAWRTRRITNFEYLLRLNVIAGRSFNDLSQYPVFPWIIADYTSDALDLDDIENSKGQFRDLTKPIGALDPTRLEMFLERYHELACDEDMEEFMYGTHYSSAGIVLHFLLRQEPFTSLAIDFQGGHFDCPDRLFFNVAESWRGCTSSMSDVKEVIPEWYCFPEAFLNRNQWDLGELQTGPQVHDVILPPWAKGDTPTKRAFEFIRINRKALESEYVSMNLHHWIDLIFGEDQRNIDKCNVFHPMTYENAVDMEAIEDQVQREAAVAQIRHFGQTPTQLLKKPHPKRLPVNECMRPLCSSHEMIENMKFWIVPKHARPADNKPHGSVQALIIVGDRLVSIYGDLTVNLVRWSNMPDGSGLPFTLTNRTTKVLPEKATAKSPFTLNDSRRPSQPASQKSTQPNAGPIFGSFGICTSSGGAAAAVPNVGGDSRLLSCGYWDGALKCHALESSSMRLQASTSGGHCGDVTVLQVGTDGQTVVTGGADATCRVWIVDNAGMASALTAEDPLDVNPYIDSTNQANAATDQQGGMSAAANDLGLLSSHDDSDHKAREISEDKEGLGEGEEGVGEGGVEKLLRCVHILWGHEAPISAVALSSTLDLVVSGAENGHVLIHRVQAGDHVRNLVDATTPGIEKYGPISLITISAALCYVVVHCRQSLSLRVFSINGDLLSETKTSQRLNAMVVSNVGDLLIVGGDSGALEIYSIHNLELLRTKSFQTSKSKKGAEEGGAKPSPITALTFGKDFQYLFIGTEVGEVWICTDPRIRLEMLDIAINRTFAGMI